MFRKIDFANTKSLYHIYIKSLDEREYEKNKKAIIEVKRRLNQLSLLMDQISKLLVNETNSKNRNIPSEKLWMYVECFYYLGFRARNVIRKLPGMSNFDCPGIRNVRNKLLEHPESKDSGLFTESFSWGKASGPVIKAKRRESEALVFPDAGLFANYLEFQTTFDAKLSDASAARNG